MALPAVNSSKPLPPERQANKQPASLEDRVAIFESVILQTGTFLVASLVASIAFPPAAPIFLSCAAGLVVILIVECVAACILYAHANDQTQESTALLDDFETIEALPESDVLPTQEPEEVEETDGFNMLEELSDDALRQAKQRIATTTHRMFTGKDMLTNQEIQDFVQVMSRSELIRYLPGQYIDPLYFQNKQQLSGEIGVQPIRLTIVPVVIEGKGPLSWIRSRLSGSSPQYSENHFGVFIIDHNNGKIEYFDSKHTPLHGQLMDLSSGMSVEERKNQLCKEYKIPPENFSQYGFRGNPEELQVQKLTDWTTCGVQGCRQIEQYIQHAEAGSSALPPPLPVLEINSKEYQEQAERYADAVVQMRVDALTASS